MNSDSQEFLNEYFFGPQNEAVKPLSACLEGFWDDHAEVAIQLCIETHPLLKELYDNNRPIIRTRKVLI